MLAGTRAGIELAWFDNKTGSTSSRIGRLQGGAIQVMVANFADGVADMGKRSG